jgi:hypothetical protein
MTHTTLADLPVPPGFRADEWRLDFRARHLLPWWRA